VYRLYPHNFAIPVKIKVSANANSHVQMFTFASFNKVLCIDASSSIAPNCAEHAELLCKQAAVNQTVMANICNNMTLVAKHN